MHWVEITHSWEGAIPPHSWVICWVIFNPTILTEYRVYATGGYDDNKLTLNK